MAQLGFLRRNVFKAFFLIALGLITMTADATIFFRSDPLFPFSGLFIGIVVVILGVRWMGKNGKLVSVAIYFDTAAFSNFVTQ